MRVLDLGGTPAYWQKAPVRPGHVVTLNLVAETTSDTWVDARVGDACSPPASVLGLRPFDLVVSNSLIEHVGGHVQRQRLAEVIATAAPRHWVQTPYRYFPVEPHWMFPGLQFLPFAARVAVTKTWPMGHRYASNDADAVASVHEVDLLGLRQMRSYFPTSTMWIERLAGAPKSIVAVKE
jgi:hypothetical protein